jgi:3'-5' exoribonuclease 1
MTIRLAHVDELLCIDLEATCWENDEDRRRETIEIGAVRYRPGAGVVAEHQQFVRPVKFPVLSELCTTLTGITQAQVEASATFPDALRRLREFAGDDPVLCSWSDFDREQLFKDCALHRLDYPFAIHIDVMKLFAGRTGRPYLPQHVVLQACGLTPQGRAHSAIDDARNLAQIVDWLVRGEGQIAGA